MEVVIDFGTGWSCSNSATETLEKDLVTIEGKRFSKHTKVVRAMHYLTVQGVMESGMEAEFAYKDHEGKYGYKGRITGLTPEMVILEVTENIDYKSITQKIKRRI